MNKQEFQQTIKNMKPPKFFTAITLNEAYEAGFEEAKGNALCNSCFLNEPEKPVVPQFVADWYEEHKDDFEDSVYDFCIQFSEERLNDDLYKWFSNDNNKPIETLVLMHKFGYEVEKEKLYTVEIPNPNRADVSLVLGLYNDGKVAIFIVFIDSWKYEKRYKLTEAEIKQDFEWAWQFAKEVEE